MFYETKRFGVRIEPERGGKITEVVDLRLGRNLLASECSECRLPLDDGFVFSVSGWDEAIPSLEPHADVPALGYACRMAAECRAADGEIATFWRIPGWEINRAIVLCEAGFAVRYLITNTGESPSPLLWAAHVLFPSEGLLETVIPHADPLPGLQCDPDDLRLQLREESGAWHIDRRPGDGRSWKFFVKAEGEVVLKYDDAVLALATDAPWWGVWINRGRIGLPCMGIEPTNYPSDYLQDVSRNVPPNGHIRVSWNLTVHDQ